MGEILILRKHFLNNMPLCKMSYRERGRHFLTPKIVPTTVIAETQKTVIYQLSSVGQRMLIIPIGRIEEEMSLSLR